MKNKLIAIVLGLFLLTLLTIVGVLAAGETLSRYVISGGGGIGLTDGQNYNLHGTLGQPVAGMVAVPDGYRLCSGFWCGGELQEGEYPTIYLPLTTNGWPPTHAVTDEDNGFCPGYGPLEFAPHQYQADFATQYDKDWYAFEATQGNTYTIATYRLGSKTNTVVYIFGPEDNLTCPNDYEEGFPYYDDCGGLVPGADSCIVDWVASSTGTHYIRVRNYDWGIDYGPDTEYSLRIIENP